VSGAGKGKPGAAKAKPGGKDGPPVIKAISTNRRALHEYHVHERIEAGIQLLGSEVKSLRDGKVSLAEGWADFSSGEAWLMGVQVNEYPWANRFNHDPLRKRKLLLHRREIDKLADKAQVKGYTVVPLALYFKNGKVKVELGIATGKQHHDKRQAAREADDKREMDRAMKRR
jgi:SsrA-binding protein